MSKEIFIESKSINIMLNGKAIAGVQSYEYTISQDTNELKRYDKIESSAIYQISRSYQLTLSRCMMYSNRYKFTDLLNKSFSIQIQKKWNNGKIDTTTFSGCIITNIKQSLDVSDYVKESLQIIATNMSST